MGRARSSLDVKDLPIVQVRANPWNPNRMTAEDYEQTIRSIALFGFVDAVKVRETDDSDNPSFEVVDGEHRWKALQEIARQIDSGRMRVVHKVEMQEGGYGHPGGGLLADDECCPSVGRLVKRGVIPSLNLGRISDSHAKQLTIVYNQLHGEPYLPDLAKLTAELHAELGDALYARLPFDNRELDDLLDAAEFDWDTFTQGLQETNTNDSETWVVVRCRMSESAAEVFAQAKTKMEVNEERLTDLPDELKNGQMLELLAADYIAGP